MADLKKTKKTALKDVKEKKLQIKNLLSRLLGNKDLIRVGSTPNRPCRTDTNTLELPSTSSESSDLFRHAKNSSEGKTTGKIIHHLKDENTGMGTDTAARISIQFASPVYTYLESNTFLVSVSHRWIWGTTIVNTSKTAALFPDLTLIFADPTLRGPFSYNFTVSLVQASASSSNASKFSVDFPFQRSASSFDSPSVNKIQSACEAKITAIFETPSGYWTMPESRRGILACLTLSGKFQWCQEVKLVLGSVSISKDRDNTFERFEDEILCGMTSCQMKLIVEPLLTQPQINQSPSKAFSLFLLSLGFTQRQTYDLSPKSLPSKKQSLSSSSRPTTSTYQCRIESQLFAAIVTIDGLDPTTSKPFDFTFFASSHRQMETLIALLVNWRDHFNKSNCKTGSPNGIRVLLSDPNYCESKKRSALVAEIEVLKHLMMLGEREDLQTPHVVSNWIRVFLDVSGKSDIAFRSDGASRS